MEELKLPSGATVKIRRPGPMARQRAAAAAKGDDDEAANTRALVLVAECVVEPKLWVDLRSPEDRLSRPAKLPEGHKDIDDVLDYPDFIAVAKRLNELISESMEAARPFFKTDESSA